MQVHVFDSAEQVAAAVADRIQHAIALKPDLTIGLPAGRTPLPMYSELRRRYESSQIDFSKVSTFNLDEFLGVAADDPGSYRRFMHDHFFGGVNLDASRIHFLDGATSDPAAECRRYEHALDVTGRVDIQILGIGVNGHIGFNEPGDELVARTHRTTLLPSTRAANAALFGGNADDVPRYALTMGIGTILSARDILLMASGEAKAQCIEQAVRGGVTPQMPASFLQLHPRVEIFLDRLAAARLAP